MKRMGLATYIVSCVGVNLERNIPLRSSNKVKKANTKILPQFFPS